MVKSREDSVIEIWSTEYINREPALELGEIVNRAVDKVAEGMVASELGAR